LAASVEAATELLRGAKDAGDVVAEKLSQCSLAVSRTFQGALAAARAHAAQAFVPSANAPHAFDVPANQVMTSSAYPLVGVRGTLSWGLLLQGYFDQAVSAARQAVAAAAESSHPYGLAIIHHHSCILHQLLRNLHEVERQSAALVALAAEHGFPIWSATGAIFRGWCMALSGEPEAGVAEMRRGLTAKQGTGHQLFVPYLLGLIASVSAEAAPQEATSLLADALVLAENTGERWFEAELHRLRGELLLGARIPDACDAESCFQRALAIAREQSAKLWELHSATSLARLWCSRGRLTEAHELLTPVYNSFTEGFDTADLQEAKSILDTIP
jgi:predicted ATPase